MVLHIFNPSHDEALGFGSPYYVPTKAAMLLARERCTLPELWAKPGDAILLTDDRERPVANDTEKPFLYRKYPKLRKTLSRRNEMYNAQMELVERLEREGKILVIRPERPLEVGRLCKDTEKMRRLYDEGYEVAKRTFEQFLKG